ncbi:MULTISPECIES: ribonuclease D [Ahrensia]|uniref:ribonuclease D n=1 Tax=Ahrensia TaxID=152180 RepID=UPI000378E226|nr:MULTISPECIES: ribonuclease D [Ahrensia]
MSLITINDTATLADVCARFATHKYVTVDTEFVRETTFWPDLCLVQVASDDEAVLIDPLAEGIDLTPLHDLMANKDVIKVFHAARQDVEIFYKLSGKLPEPLFDTQVAAMVCGFGDSIAYDQLVRRISGAHIDKSLRFTNWKLRPLSDQQLEYALADVTHLRDVYNFLKDKLEEENRTHWLTEEMDILTTPKTYDLPPNEAWTRLKLRIKKPIEFAILKNLAEWRENEARERNVPRNRIIKDDAIYEIAQSQPKDTDGLSRLRTLHKGFEKSASGRSIIDCVARAHALDRDELPKIPRPAHSPEGTSAAVDLLKVLLKLTAEEFDVAAKIIASSDQLEQIAILGEEADVPAMKGWRKELFGERAMKLLDGKSGLRFENRKIGVVDI